jgi:hypothetical protein
MDPHVDIIRNEPLAGSSFVLAKVTLGQGGSCLDLQTPRDADEGVMWGYLRSRVEIDPDRDPEGFLHALPEAIDSTYVIASRVHDDAECPYVHNAPPLSR